jgi:hypothetical protein
MRKIVQILRKMAARQQIGWYSNMGNNTNAQYLDQDPSGPILLNTARPGLLACRGGKVDRKLWAIVRLIHEGAHVLDEEDQFPKGSGSSAEEEFKANQAALAVYRAYKRLYGYCDTDMEERQRLAETFVTSTTAQRILTFYAKASSGTRSIIRFLPKPSRGDRSWMSSNFWR